METEQKYWYEWGNEKTGYVSHGYYLNGEWKELGQILKSEAIANRYEYKCPYS